MLRSQMFVRPIAALTALAFVLNTSAVSMCSADPSTPVVMAPFDVPPGKILVAQTTPVNLILDQDLKSGSCHTGDQIEYDLASDLYTPDRQLIAPAGTKAYGKVLQSSGHGMFGKPGKLEISADYLLFARQLMSMGEV